MTPQEMHTGEVSWLLFAHRKHKRSTSKSHKHPALLCGPPSLATPSFLLACWLDLGTQRLRALPALSQALGIQGCRGPDAEWGGHFKERCSQSRAGSFPQESVTLGAQHGVQSVGRCWHQGPGRGVTAWKVPVARLQMLHQQAGTDSGAHRGGAGVKGAHDPVQALKAEIGAE